VRAVNLLPADEQRPRLQGARVPALLVAGGLASASARADDERGRLAEVEAAIAALPAAPTPAVSQVALAKERSDRLAALTAALDTRVAFDRVLREISLVLPDDAWLTGIAATAPTPSSGTAGAPSPASGLTEAVTIQGATYSHDAAARVVARLAAVPSLVGVRLTASALVEPEAASPGRQADGPKAPAPKRRKPLVTFTVVASLRSGGVR